MAVRRSRSALAFLILICSIIGGAAAARLIDPPASQRWRQHDIHRPRPPVVEPAAGSPAAAAPKDAVVLFDGTGMDAWQTSAGEPSRWKVKDGYLEIVPGTG